MEEAQIGNAETLRTPVRQGMKSAAAGGLRARSAYLTSGLEGPTEGVRGIPLGLDSEEPYGGAARGAAGEGASAKPVGPETGACPGRALEAHPRSPESPG